MSNEHTQALVQWIIFISSMFCFGLHKLRGALFNVDSQQ